MHSHANPDQDEARMMLPQLYQGITTVVLGVDGQGDNDLTTKYHTYRKQGIGVNVASYVGFNAARHEVMGMSNQAAKSEQIEQMQHFISKGMQQGAFGISSGLFYRPASYASTQEVIDVASSTHPFNGIYDTHDRDMGAALDGIGYDASVAEAIEIGEKSGNRVIFSHFTPQGKHNYGRANVGIELINKARDRGVNVVAAQHPYTATQSSLLAYTLPDWALADGTEELFKRIKHTKIKTEIEKDSVRMLEIRGGADKLVFVDNNISLNGKTLASVAKEKDTSVFETVIEIAKEQGDANVMNIGLYDMNNIRLLAQQEWMMNSTDGGSEPAGQQQGHPRNFGAFSKKIRQFVVEEKIISLAFAIRTMTSLPARFLGLANRGEIAVGQHADINIFDLAKIRDKATYNNSQQYSEGLDYVFVNGQIALANGEVTRLLAGKPIVRHQQRVEQEPSAKQMLAKLKNAFGGKHLLESINQFSAKLNITRQSNNTKTTLSYLDFSNNRIAQLQPQQKELYLVSETRSQRHIVKRDQKTEIVPIDENKKKQLLENMHLNFFSLLRNNKLQLLGPLDIPEHRDQSWWLMKAGKHVSPAIGLDRQSGRIQKILLDSGAYVIESDYQDLGNGIMWPRNFRLLDEDKVILKGEYSEVIINSPPPFETPDWFTH